MEQQFFFTFSRWLGAF